MHLAERRDRILNTAVIRRNILQKRTPKRLRGIAQRPVRTGLYSFGPRRLWQAAPRRKAALVAEGTELRPGTGLAPQSAEAFAPHLDPYCAPFEYYQRRRENAMAVI